MGRTKGTKNKSFQEWTSETRVAARTLLDLLTHRSQDKLIKSLLDFEVKDSHLTTQLAMLIHRLNSAAPMEGQA